MIFRRQVRAKARRGADPNQTLEGVVEQRGDGGLSRLIELKGLIGEGDRYMIARLPRYVVVRLHRRMGSAEIGKLLRGRGTRVPERRRAGKLC